MCVLQGAGLAATPHTYIRQMVRVLVEVLIVLEGVYVNAQNQI
jgi:hypothetical protein